jgi:hypothetical protein
MRIEHRLTFTPEEKEQWGKFFNTHNCFGICCEREQCPFFSSELEEKYGTVCLINAVDRIITSEAYIAPYKKKECENG